MYVCAYCNLPFENEFARHSSSVHFPLLYVQLAVALNELEATIPPAAVARASLVHAISGRLDALEFRAVLDVLRLDREHELLDGGVQLARCLSLARTIATPDEAAL